MPDQLRQMYDSFVPLVPSGTQTGITISQTLGDGSNTLIDTGQGTLQIKADGPQTLIGPDDISGLYPGPGSTDCPANYLPHIALKRRTLPWERTGPAGDKQKAQGKVKGPWLALLMVTEDELNGGHSNSSPTTPLTTTTVKAVQQSDAATYTQLHGAGMADDLSISVVTLPNLLLSKILPDLDELPLLCHIKSTIGLLSEQDTAMVVSNRLPNLPVKNAAPLLHTAMLVSLENRGDLYGANSRLTKAGKTTLVVLHSWTFTPSDGLDFMEVMHLISIRPNGGVLRFGNLPRPVRSGVPVPLSGGFSAVLDSGGYTTPALDHVEAGDVKWRSPLRPFPPPARSHGFAVRAAPEEFDDPTVPHDYSHATAFELGRLLALGDPGIREDLRAIRTIFDIPKEIVATSVIPAVLQKPDWVTDDPWQEEPWSFLQNTFTQGLEKAQTVDVSGIADMAKQWQSTVASQLGQQVSAPTLGTVAQIGIETVSAVDLAKQFPEVVNAALG